MEHLVSPFIDQQLPGFYQSEGPNFIAFIKAYYEWMEQEGPLYHSRRLLEYADIDSTATQFINHFKNQYINQLPTNVVANQQLLVKHILDLYRSKGTPRAYQLLFRLLFNQSIDLYIPGNDLFKPSDNTWYIPRYIEVTNSPYLGSLVGQQIYSASGHATATVESVITRTINQRPINIVYISSVSGRFKYGDQILCNTVPAITLSNAPLITGSLSAISIQNGGFGFKVGDLVNINGSGVDGIARVANTQNQNGKVNFQLVNGGGGYSTNAIITVATTLDFVINPVTGVFTPGDIITDATSSATATVTFANTSFIQTINFSNTNFVPGDVISSTGGAQAILTGVFGGGGTGASFQIGALSAAQNMSINTDYITSISDGVGNTGINVAIDISSTVNTSIANTNFTVGNTVTSSANILLIEGTIISTNTAAKGETLSNSALGIAGLYIYKSDQNLLNVTSATDSNLTNANLVANIVLTSNISGSRYLLYNTPIKQTITANAVVSALGSGNTITVAYQSADFVPYATITDTHTGHTATINSQTRATDWHFIHEQVAANLDTPIANATSNTLLTVGTIAYLSNVAVGSGYSSAPYISVVEPSVAGLQIQDGAGGYLGSDAVITGNVINANGIITAVQLVQSGIGYFPGSTVTLSKPNNAPVAIGTAVIDLDGHEAGYWRNNKSYVSAQMKIQDSAYYQAYSYEIQSPLALSSYKSLVQNLVHPSGIALYGKFKLNSTPANTTPSLISSIQNQLAS